MKTVWKDYLEMIKFDKPIDYYVDKFDGDEHKAKVAMILAYSDKGENVLINDYNIYDKIDDMVFGQFIACEKIITSGNDNNIILEILSFNILRPIEDIIFDNTDAKKEMAHVESVRNESSLLMIEILNKWIEHRNHYINSKYNGVFYQTVYDDEEQVDEEELTEDELSVEEKFSKNWYWYSMVRGLAGEDILKIENILMTPMADISPELAYRRQKHIVDETRRKRQTV